MGVPSSSRTWTLAVTMSPSRAATAVGVSRPREVDAVPARLWSCVGVSEQTGLDSVGVVWRQKPSLPGQPRTFSSPRDDSSGPAGADAADAKEGRGDAGQRQRQQQGHRAHSSLVDNLSIESAGVAAPAAACPTGRFKGPPCLFEVVIGGSIPANFDQIRCWEHRGVHIGDRNKDVHTTLCLQQQQRLVALQLLTHPKKSTFPRPHFPLCAGAYSLPWPAGLRRSKLGVRPLTGPAPMLQAPSPRGSVVNQSKSLPLTLPPLPPPQPHVRRRPSNSQPPAMTL